MIAMRRIGVIDPAAMRRAAARAWPRHGHGSRAIPEHVVRTMHEDYLRCGSLRVTAAGFGRTKQDLAYIFKKRGLPVKARGGVNRGKARRKI